jgi:integrase
LLWFGLRIGELKLIRHIDYEKGELEVETEKIGGSRKLFFDKFTARQLEIAESNKLFELPAGVIRHRLRKWTRALAPVKVSPHIFRHTFASFFGPIAGPFLLKRMLGHGHESATDIYVHPEEDKVRDLMINRHFLLGFEPKAFRQKEMIKNDS